MDLEREIELARLRIYRSIDRFVAARQRAANELTPVDPLVAARLRFLNRSTGQQTRRRRERLEKAKT